MNEPPPPEMPDYEFYWQKAYSVGQRGYRRLYGRNALRMLEMAYAQDVARLCERIEELEEGEKA